MVSLLELAQSYVDRGLVECIRLSTRPDYISEEIVSILSSYSVKTVELGLQSLDDEVLVSSKRGHDAECAERACKMLKDAGFELVGQMMIGLPNSNSQKEILTARRICELGADGARVYPTVVFAETELSQMLIRGEYTPLDTDEAVERTKNVLSVFDGAGVPCIRVGLCASENLRDASVAIAGATHAAIGEMAMSALYLERICAELDRRNIRGGGVVVYVARGCVSKAVGQKRINKLKICEKYGLEWVKVLEKNEIIGYNIIIEHTI
jgi:histone acetyltransferase (RNA polymerase elongator complex component)